MAILRIGAFGKSHIVPAAFDNEQEIERVIAENPQLIVADGAIPPVLLARHLTVHECTLGLLLLDAASVPVVVESTLAASNDGPQEVVARAIHAISALTQLTAAQLEHATGGAVERALRTFAAAGTDLGQLWTSLALNLRAARVKFVVAVDELSPTMDRQIRFLAEHSSFDVQCVALAKSREPSGDIYYMPTLIPADRVPAPRSIRLVGSAAPASHRRASASYEVMRREGALPFDLERVQWDG